MSKGGPSNVALLTQGDKIWSAKKRWKKEQIKQLVFDEDARREFLTGFRKRKLARHEARKAKAIEKERQSRLEARREMRRQLANRAIENARAVEQAYAGPLELDEADTAAAPEQPVAADMEFENEEQLATVTVVEDFDAADLKTLSPERATFKENQSKGISGVAKGPPRPQQRPKNAKPTYTKPKFKYETKAARIHEKIKQRGRREERAKRKNGRR